MAMHQRTNSETTLQTPIEKLFRLSPLQKSALKRLGIQTAYDLVYYFPVSYSDPSTIKTVDSIHPGETVTLYGQIVRIDTKKSFRGHVPMAYGTFEDATGKLRIAWFNQPYIAKMLPPGTLISLTGLVTEDAKGVTIVNGECEKIDSIPVIPGSGNGLFAEGPQDSEADVRTGRGIVYATYAETRGITSKWLRHAMKRVVTNDTLRTIVDPLPSHIVEQFNLPSLETALVWIHMPRSQKDALAARKRFAFEEVFYIQLQKQRDRILFEREHGWEVAIDMKRVHKFSQQFGFALTQGQTRIMEEIRADLSRPFPMSRLLEGDVGSGKTALAALASYAIINASPKNAPSARLQVAYMCPTEILAKQHFESFISYFKDEHISIGLITSSGCFKFPSKVHPEKPTPLSHTQFLKYLKNGEIHILIGTHSLIQNRVQFRHLGLVIIDEQHRFGTFQRQKLAQKHDYPPHLLSMTATPIPRTLALTIFGDLDLSVLDELPPGRKPVITQLINEPARDAMYAAIKAELALGRQAYVICPRINEPDPDTERKLSAKSVKEEAKRLQKDIFPRFTIGMLHGGMSGQEKDKVMKLFTEGDIHILVATSVVEVGVNVPNATCIVIEGGERFGLSQLHQLRGRVMRSSHQAYCFICAAIQTQKTKERLEALTKAKNGFELAEYDLAFRGTGELYGMRQWGLSDLAMEAIKNIKLVEAARTEARKLIEEDMELSRYPLLRAKVVEQRSDIHFE